MNDGGKKGHPSQKKHYSTAIGSSNVEMVAYSHRHLLIITLVTSFLEMSTSMTLNDLEHPK